MNLDDVIDALEYRSSAGYLTADELRDCPANGFIHYRAAMDCGLQGAYTLRDPARESTVIPVVYVCQVDDDVKARTIHKHVWQQDIVPFLIVISPKTIRVYPGYRFEQNTGDGPDGRAVKVLRDFNRIAQDLAGFGAPDIDSGGIWKSEWARCVTHETRVDSRLLKNLGDLAAELRKSGLDDTELVHGIIGKFVYLRYLHDRDILSARKLQSWHLDEETLLTRELSVDSFIELQDHLHGWLNGSVFPLSGEQIRTIGEDRLRMVAGVFRGDEASGQLALDFANYDFSFIPIETLSVIYEQFLHAPDPASGSSRGKDVGAYYTPIPVVNYMLDRLDIRRPLRLGARILDPSCGSGAFLVQCYRRLIERAVRDNEGRKPQPIELRGLLTKHIFGIDKDPHACQIAELSLILTLLDYVTPPDLEEATVRNFKLPELRGRNIFKQSAFAALPGDLMGSFDVIVGNPPWKEVKRQGALSTETADSHLEEWLSQNSSNTPTGGGQLAEMFAWRSAQLLDRSHGVASLLMPAMTLFKGESEKFRKAFFSNAPLWEVTNFAGLVNVLFAGRSTVPAAVFSFGVASESQSRSPIAVYSPFLANQPMLTASRSASGRNDAWSLSVNIGELRTIRQSEAISGCALHWKLASWGSYLDQNLLNRVHREYVTLGEWEKRGVITIAPGFELRKSTSSGPYTARYHDELVGKRKLLISKLRERRYLWRIPVLAVGRVAPEEAYVRDRGGFERPMRVCEPPHVIVSASGTFSVWENEYITLPPRQIGIGSTRHFSSALKAIALYLNSDFVRYFRFLHSAEAGIQKSRFTKKDLDAIPLPIDLTKEQDTRPWLELFEDIQRESGDLDEFGDRIILVHRLNDLAADVLRLSKRERALVNDLVNVRMDLTRGKVSGRAVESPKPSDLHDYAIVLRDHLDDFLGEESDARHKVRVAYGSYSAVVEIVLIIGAQSRQEVSVERADNNLSVQIALARGHTVTQFAQWFYFNRNLRIYEGMYTYVCKPMQLLQWTYTQAFIDAGEIIADVLVSPAEETT
ncbi:MAG: class I SAM-dependent DNA methyltransferase [Capsulimonadaceae bacterium]